MVIIVSWLIVVLLAVSTGFLIAYLAKDELVAGRKWFSWIFIIGLLAGICFFITNKISESYSFIFLAIICLISYLKSFDKKKVRK